jgi:dihydroneopterin aldolase/2-amino-4-hydroxy-6-hydroxymethyldihydropteridine diphosphokinase
VSAHAGNQDGHGTARETRAFAGAVAHDAAGRRLDRIRLTGITATGYHGVFEHERRDGQEFVADVVVHLDTRRAAAHDDLAQTLDYGTLAQHVAGVLAGDPADLIETVAERIAATVLAFGQAVAVDVAVHKPQAPIPVPFGDVVVEIHRDRDKLPAAEPWRPPASEPARERVSTSGPVRTVTAQFPLVPARETPVPVSSATASAEDLAGDEHDLTDPLPDPHPQAPHPPVPHPPAPLPPVPHPHPPTPVPGGAFSLASLDHLDELDSVPYEPERFETGPLTGGPFAPAQAAAGPSAAEPFVPVPFALGPSAAGPSAASPESEDAPVAPRPPEPTWFAVGEPVPAVSAAEPPEPRPPLELTSSGRPDLFGILGAAPDDVVDGELVTDQLDEAPARAVDVVLAIGSNLGSAQETLRDAVYDLAGVPGIEVVDVSPLARTAPVGGPEQPDFLNAVVLARTTLSPRDLLRVTQHVEQLHGRDRTEHWGPRTLDVDIIVYGTTLAVTEDLELPHPRAHQRAFVLQPWAQLVPDAVLPGLGGGPVAALAATAPDKDGIRWLALDWLTVPVPAVQPEPGPGGDPGPRP